MLNKVAKDKKLHFIAGFFSTFGCFIYGPFFFLGFILAILKEIYDKISGKGTPEIDDTIYTMFGALLSCFVIFMYSFFVTVS
jgi:hypothetical protein